MTQATTKTHISLHIRAVTSPLLVIAAFTLNMTFIYDRYSGDVHQLYKKLLLTHLGRLGQSGFIVNINSRQTLFHGIK